MLRLLSIVLVAFLIVLAWPNATAEPPAGEAPSYQRGDDPPIPADKDPRTTESGLVYSVLREGTGKVSPRPADIVIVHYTGWLEDGKVFDTSRRNGQPSTMALNRVIPGWTEGVGLMTEGAVFKLTLPPALAYGERGYPGAIPPDATLTFEIELVAIVQLPVYSEGNEEKQRVTESGLVYEVLKPGTGGGLTPQSGQVCELKFARWNKKERVLVESTEQMGRTIKRKIDDLTEPLQEAARMLHVGERMRFEAAPRLYYGEGMRPQHEAQGPVVFELELVQLLLPLPVPPFTMPNPEELETTESGLQYQVIREGDGARSPVMGQGVDVHYAGWLTDGTKFDDSFSRAEPSTFLVGQVIEGWNEALQMMSEGAVYKLVIPFNLAYGERGRQGIPPSSDLVFHVELIKIHE